MQRHRDELCHRLVPARRAALGMAVCAAAWAGAGCGGDPGDAEPDGGVPAFDAAPTIDAPVDAWPPWPETIEPLPSCEPYPGGFVMPEVAPPHGLVELDVSAPLQPAGVDEHIDIKVRRIGTGEVDTGASSPLTVDVGPSASLVSLTPVTAGRAQAVVRFHGPGRHGIRAEYPDGRSGTVEIESYEPQLPIWNMTIDPVDLAYILDNRAERVYVPGAIEVDGVDYPAEIRIHGGSSRYYRKASFRIDLARGLALPDGSNHLILRAEWNDKSMLRNYLGMEVFRNATWVPTPRAEMVHFRINGRYYGVMWHMERIDGDFLRRNRLYTDGSMYEADPAWAYAVPGGNLTPLPSLETYRATYDHKKGIIDYDDLIELIEVILQLDDEAFAEVIDQVVRVDTYLVYMAAMSLIQNQDHIRKNFFIYRNPYGRDDRWMVFPWDLELSFGHLWTEENDVLDETIFYDRSLYAGMRVPEHDFYNQLMSRLWNLPEFTDRFHEFVDHIMETRFTREFIDERVSNAVCRGTPDLLADHRKRASNEEYMSRVEEIGYFVDQRRSYVLGQ